MDDKIKDTLRDYRLASQTYLADALGFKGGVTEKVLYADLMSLSWIAEPEYPQPVVVPSILYGGGGEMYNRDSFFAVTGCYDQELNEKIFSRWGANQGENGCINTLIPSYVANQERKSNEATCEWLIWALLNKHRYGTSLPMEKIHKAAEYCLNTYDPDRDGICWAEFVMGQNDVIHYPEGTDKLAENQGLWAVTLRVIKELKIPGVSEKITNNYIQKAEAAYRSFYDPVGKFIRTNKDIPDVVGLNDLRPEFLSLWLFHRKILTDEMVCNTLDRIPLMGSVKNAPYPEMGGVLAPVVIRLTNNKKGWSYFTPDYHPVMSDEHAAGYADHKQDGTYYNGGSWMRPEICAYAVGKLHGWKKSDKAIANRLWAEINLNPDYPTSQEYQPTDPNVRVWGGHRVFAWNVFVLQAMEMAGLRTPDMDPDFKNIHSNKH